MINMKSICGGMGRCAGVIQRILFATTIVLPMVGFRSVEADEPIVRIEEDWEAVFEDPDPAIASPQYTTYMISDNASIFEAQFDWNMRDTFPNVGGYQISVWSEYDAQIIVEWQPFEEDETTVTWTQVMETQSDPNEDEESAVAVLDGFCHTWGAFGGQNNIIRGLPGMGDTYLNEYDPTDSMNNSGISLGSNRVKSLKIVEVRRYSATRLVDRITEPFVVHQQ